MEGMERQLGGRELAGSPPFPRGYKKVIEGGEEGPPR